MVSVHAFHRSRTTDEADNLWISLNKENFALHGSFAQNQNKLFLCNYNSSCFLFLHLPFWRIRPFVSSFCSEEIQRFCSILFLNLFFLSKCLCPFSGVAISPKYLFPCISLYIYIYIGGGVTPISCSDYAHLLWGVINITACMSSQ